jgi:hypothetical protein
MAGLQGIDVRLIASGQWRHPDQVLSDDLVCLQEVKFFGFCSWSTPT